MPTSSGIVVHLEVKEPVVVGLSVLATIYVINRGRAPVTVSSRLNLMEGDIHLLLTDPSGNQQKVTGAGGQPDTMLRRATLQPGQQIAAGINLLYTSVEGTFKVPGTYSIQAIYFPSPRLEPVCSNSVSLSVRLPQEDIERQMVSVLQRDAVKRAITLAESGSTPNELLELATRFADTLDGKLASLLISENQSPVTDEIEKGKTFSFAEPITTALLITALSTPFTNAGKQLKNAFITFLEAPLPVDKLPNPNDSEQTAKALKIANGQPFEN